MIFVVAVVAEEGDRGATSSISIGKGEPMLVDGGVIYSSLN